MFVILRGLGVLVDDHSIYVSLTFIPVTKEKNCGLLDLLGTNKNMYHNKKTWEWYALNVS